MEDLIWLLLIVLAVGALVALAVTAFVIAATIAAIIVFGAAIHGFAVTMYRGVVHRGGAAAASGPGEPSFRAYYRTQVWADMGLSARAAWKCALEETTRIRRLVPDFLSPTTRTVVGAALTVYAFAGLAIGAFAASMIGIVPALAIALLAVGAWCLGSPLRAAERLRRRRTGAYFDCQECHDRFPLPHYVCPQCDARHAQLAPGPFGVQRHRCTCGARLPALAFRGRERLASECPQGHALGEGVGTVRTFHVPVAGGPSTGKSTFLAAALIELDEAATGGTLATDVQASSRQAYDRIIDGFRQGVPPAKTSGLPPAVVAEIRGRSKSALLYAYDVAGEVYGAEDELRRDPAHGLAEGVVLLVDPFALERVNTDWHDEIDGAPGLNPSSEPPQRMLERLVGVLEEQGVDLSKLSAAICVTKIDALGIGDAIAACPGDDDHERTQAWLEQSGAGNFVRAAEEAFRDVRCFGVSALGRMPGTGSGAFAPRGAAAPLLWLLRRAGIEPAAAGEVQATTTHKIRTAAALDVSPKRPLFTPPLDAVTPMGYGANFFVGLVAAGALALAFLPFAGTSGSSTLVESAVAQQPTDSDGAAVEDGGAFEPTPTPAPTATPTPPPPRPNPNSPAAVVKRHLERLGDGRYGAAFALMSSNYRSHNPNWVLQPTQAQPFINVVKVGPTEKLGGGVAHVYVKFFGHDRYATAKSDTKCRLFEGQARMVKENGHWRYDGGDGYTASVRPSSSKGCNP